MSAPKTNITVETLSDLALTQVKREAAVAALERQLKIAKALLEEVSERDLPGCMEQLGLPYFETDTGIKVELKEGVHASITQENQPEAHRWLEENSQSGVIKRLVIASFGKGEDAWAKKFVADMRRRKKPINFEIKAAVHSSTLAALVKEMLREGIEFPLELFGVHRITTSKVTLPPKD